jgi:hypothetical protein
MAAIPFFQAVWLASALKDPSSSSSRTCSRITPNFFWKMRIFNKEGRDERDFSMEIPRTWQG